MSQGISRALLEGGASDVGLGDESWPGQIAGDLSVQRDGERITVRGRVQATAALECARCLGRFVTPFDVPLEVFAERAGSGNRRDELELERDDYMRFHDGRKLDLSDEVRESLLLELPITPYCREDCRGLCPRCGADLNEGPCACPDAE